MGQSPPSLSKPSAQPRRPPRVSAGAGGQTGVSRAQGSRARLVSGPGGTTLPARDKGRVGAGGYREFRVATPREESVRESPAGRRAGGAESSRCYAVTRGARAEPLILGPVLGRSAQTGDELPATRPQGLLPPGGDQNGLGGARRVPGPAARGLWCLWCSVVSVRRTGWQAGQAAAGDYGAGSLAKLSAPQLCNRQPHW